MKQRFTQIQLVDTLRQLAPFLRPERRQLLVAAAVTLLLTAVEVSSPLLIGAFVDSILSELNGNSSDSSPALGQRTILILLAAAAVARGYLLARQGAQAGAIGERVAARLRDRLWSHVQNLPLDYTRARGSGRLLLRFVGDTRAIQRLVTEGLVRLTQEVMLGCAILAALLVLNLRMALVVVAMLPVYASIFRRINPELRKASRATRRRRSRISAYLNERIAGIDVIKAYTQQPAETSRFAGLTRSLAKRGSYLATVRGRLQGLSASTVAGGGVLVLAMASREVSAGRLTGGEFVAFYTLLGLLTPIFGRVVNANRYFQEARISVERLAETLAEVPESPAEETLPPLVITTGAVEIRNVTFRYGSGPPALTDVNLEAKRGELVALVGPNGSGKSTLLDLLVRFRQPEQGRIVIDGQDIACVALASLRSQIGSATQDAPLFDGTIAENIAYGVGRDIPEEQVLHAAQRAGVDRLALTLPDGWDTRVGHGGRLLSAGQRQRIALARALAADPPILLLDEVTSALDAESEQALARTFRAIAGSKTVIVIAHRVPTLRLADRIYVLDAGRIVEAGDHATLLGRGGVYARLFGPRSGGDRVSPAHSGNGHDDDRNPEAHVSTTIIRRPGDR